VTFKVALADHQHFAVRDFDLRPAFRPEDDLGPIIFVTAGRFLETLEDASARLENLRVQPAFGGTTTVADNAVVLLKQLRTDASVEFAMSGCEISGHRGLALEIDIERGTASIDHTRLADNGSYLWPYGDFGTGLDFSCVSDARLRLDHVASEGNRVVGVRCKGPTDPDATLDLEVRPGCRFDDNGSTGFTVLNGAGRTVPSFTGTPETPNTFSRNGDLGLAVAIDSSAEMHLQNAVMCNNGDVGLYISRSGSGPSAPILVERCLFARNSTDPNPSNLGTRSANNLALAVNSSSPASFEFRRCTFHDAVNTEGLIFGGLPVQAGEIDLFTHVVHNLHLELVDCILSGTVDEGALMAAGVTNTSVHLDHCVVTMGGPYALGSLDPGGTEDLTQDAVLHVDPVYVNVTVPPGADSFDVRNSSLATAGSDGGPLSGWGRYVGPPAGPSHGILIH
jgi:hypothetical protein